MDDLEGEPLAGGAITPVVAIGDTVRRPRQPWTATVHALLEHLADRGIAFVPRALGYDRRGREILRTVGRSTGWRAWGWPAPPDPGARLRLLCDAYGLDAGERRELLPSIRARQLAAYEATRQWAAEGRPGWPEQWNLPAPWHHGAGYLRDVAFVDARRQDLEHALR